MILGDSDLRVFALNGGVDPFDEKLINPASIDLRLGTHIRHSLDNDWSGPLKIENDGYAIKPDELVLLHTFEHIKMRTNLTGVLFLKSSAGRKGLNHLMAGYIDPGFEGEITLEIKNESKWTHVLLPKMRIMQLCLIKTTEVEIPYAVRGHYQHQTGPTISWEK